MVFKNFSVLQENRQASNEIKKTILKQNENFKKDIKTIKENQNFWNWKTQWLSWKIQDSFKCRLDRLEESIIQLEDRSLEITQSE